MPPPVTASSRPLTALWSRYRTHDELVASGGVYAGLWSVQTGAGDLPDAVGRP